MSFEPAVIEQFFGNLREVKGSYPLVEAEPTVEQVSALATRILDHGDMSYIAIQIASGMEYLAQHQVRKIFTDRKNI